jgi:T5SS/PEP-CTERM-associated repeat protein
MPRTLAWTGASGSAFADAGNWQDLTDYLDPATAAPGIGDAASVAGSGTIRGPGTVLTLAFAGAPTLAGSITVGDLVSVGGTLTVASGGDLNTARLDMASGSKLVVQSSATVALTASPSNGEAALALGSSPDTTGTVLVSGQSGMFKAGGEIVVGAFGAGVLSVGNAGTVLMTGSVPDALPAIAIGDDAASANGIVTVSGRGALLDAGGHRISVGNIGAGTLLVTQGAAVRASAAGYSKPEEATHFGYYSSGVGIVTIDGAGSTFAANGAAVVADAGVSTLQVSNGALFSAGGTNDGGLGLIVDAGGGTGDVQVSAGTLTVSDGAKINSHGTLIVGNGGVATIGGSLELNGGIVSLDATSALTIGGAELTRGAVAVAPAGQFIGAGSIGADLNDEGTVTASGGRLDITGAVAGDGTLVVGPDGTPELDVSTVAPVIAFAAPGGTLELTATAPPLVTIDNFAPGDSIVVDAAMGGTMTSVAVNGTTFLSLTLSGGGLATLDVAGTPSITLDQASGLITACFAEGTRISTLRGEVPVEHLRVGDRVVRARNPQEDRVVRWVGWRTINLLDLPPGARRLTVGSRRMRPAELDADSDDCRELGVPLLGWQLDGADMPLHHPGLQSGWLPPEGGVRWSNGAATVDVTGAVRAAFRFGTWPRYVLHGHRRSMAAPADLAAA